MVTSQQQQARNDLRSARQGLAHARRGEATAERAYERACAGWVTGKCSVAEVEEAERALEEARQLRVRVEAAEAHLQPLAPARLAGT